MKLQEQILVFFESIRTDVLTVFFTTVTMMAEHLFLLPLLAVLYWLVDKRKSRRLAWFMLFNGVANGMMKSIVNMPRPFDKGVVKPIRMETATGSSFPSGHTQTATSFWMGSMFILKTNASIILGSIMIILTALSRLYLGVHWPMDVVAAIAFGIIFTYFAHLLIDEEGEFTEFHIILSSLLCLLVLIFKVEADLYKTVAALWGLCIGSYLENKYIQFEVKGSKRYQITKIVIGLIGILVIYVGMSKLLPAQKVVSMIKYALVIIWIMAGAPYLFNKLKKK